MGYGPWVILREADAGVEDGDKGHSNEWSFMASYT